MGCFVIFVWFAFVIFVIRQGRSGNATTLFKISAAKLDAAEGVFFHQRIWSGTGDRVLFIDWVVCATPFEL
jgi:hypothetical protein